MRRRPGFSWRVLAHRQRGNDSRFSHAFTPKDRVCFDELVIDDWFHMEQMDHRDWWIGLAGLAINVHIPSSGKPHVLIELDDPGRLDRLRNFAPGRQP